MSMPNNKLINLNRTFLLKFKQRVALAVELSIYQVSWLDTIELTKRFNGMHRKKVLVQLRIRKPLKFCSYLQQTSRVEIITTQYAFMSFSGALL